MRGLWVLALSLLLFPGNASAQQKPSIVLVLMDNLGWGEPGVYGGGILRGAPTPRIDQLAAEGMRRLNYNVEAQALPSRAALMTGPPKANPGGLSKPVPISMVEPSNRSLPFALSAEFKSHDWSNRGNTYDQEFGSE